MTFPPSFEADPTRRRPSLSEVKHPSAPFPSQEVPNPPTPEQNAPGVPGAPEQVRQWRITPSPADPAPSGEPPASLPSTIPPSYAPAQDRRRPSLTSPERPAGPESPTAPEQLPPAYLPASRRQASTSSALPPSYSPSGRVSSSPSPATASPSLPREDWRETLHKRIPTPRSAPSPRPRTRRPWLPFVAAVLIVVLLWPAFLVWDASSHLKKIDALSSQSDTPGTTYLLAGSDSRADGSVPDDTQGQRADSIMLVHVAANGQTSMISLPRDTYVEVPGEGWDKLNASFAYGGPSLLVQTVEKLTGLTIDHYAEIGMGGVSSIVDAVGGVELCMDMDVEDEKSELSWTSGCHLSDGKTALAFARMRYSDPRGDIGRAERQRQVVSKTVSTAMSPSTFINPARTLQVERAGASAFTVDRGSGVFDVAQLVMAFRQAQKSGMTGTPPIESLGYATSAGSAVLLEDTTAPDFFNKLRAGTLTTEDLRQMP